MERCSQTEYLLVPSRLSASPPHARSRSALLVLWMEWSVKRSVDLFFLLLLLVCLSCPTPCDPMDCDPPGSPVHGILQERIPEWVAVSSPRSISSLASD